MCLCVCVSCVGWGRGEWGGGGRSGSGVEVGDFFFNLYFRLIAETYNE